MASYVRLVVVPLLAILFVGGLEGSLFAEDPAPLTMALPPQAELDKLADLTAQFAGVSIQYNPQKVHGTVRLAVRGQVTPAELWEIFNQVLVSQGFTTVLAGLPPVYQVVPLAEAGGISVPLTIEEAAKIPYQPGYAVVVFELKHLSAEAAVKALSTMMTNQVGQVRTLGQEDRKLVVSAARGMLGQVAEVLKIIDRPGIVPVVRLYRPLRASPQSLQATASATWTAFGRIGGTQRVAETQLSPDGSQLLLIASTEDIDQLDQLVQRLDNAEPMETRSYRPRYFSIEEVSSLLQQLMRSDRGGQQAEIIRDKLTSSLIIKATAEQHRRVEAVLKTLDDAPPIARRQVHTFAVRHRQADELAKVLTGLIASGVVRAGETDGTAPANPATVAATAQAPQPLPGALPGNALPVQPRQPGDGATTMLTAPGENPVMLASDVITNTIIAIGDPKALDQVEGLLKRLDQRQPQVDIEITLVSISMSQNRNLGIELVRRIQSGSVTTTVTQLFGLSGPGDGVGRVPLPTAMGLGGVILNPGDFAGVIQALETVTDGRQVIRAKVVVNNNAKASVNGVVQEPLISTNASSTVATTSVTGTTDAGTQIAISPQISTADYLSLTYSISQSSFLGKSSDPGIPPTKRSDSVSSVATIPDGFIIALGGLSNRNEDHTESRIPFLGGIPYIGNLFKSQSKGESESRFFVFIRATILRGDIFSDLRRMSTKEGEEAKLSIDEPQLSPQLIR